MSERFLQYTLNATYIVALFVVVLDLFWWRPW